MRRTGSLLLTFLLLATPSAALAQLDPDVPAHANLHFTPMPGCVDEATFRTLVEEVLERRVFVADTEADLTVEASFARQGGGWLAILTLSEQGRPAGRREIASDDPSCDALTGPASLVVALMVDAHRPQLRLRAPEVPVSPTLPPRHEPATPWTARTGLSFRASHGAMPGLAAGLTLDSVLISPSGIPIQASLTLWPTDESSEGGVGGRFRLWHGGLGVCPSWPGGDYRAGFCAGVQAGQLEGEGLGLSRAEEPRHLWVHAEAVADVGIRLAGPLALHASVGVAVPFNRPEFVYDKADGGTEKVHRPSAVVPMAGIGLEANLSP